jgi:hypothetical protein
MSPLNVVSHRGHDDDKKKTKKRAHPVAYPFGIGGSFPESKAAGV